MSLFGAFFGRKVGELVACGSEHTLEFLPFDRSQFKGTQGGAILVAGNYIIAQAGIDSGSGIALRAVEYDFEAFAGVVDKPQPDSFEVFGIKTCCLATLNRNNTRWAYLGRGYRRCAVGKRHRAEANILLHIGNDIKQTFSDTRGSMPVAVITFCDAPSGI